jgi:serine/arginine repetitive matrix protein 2
MEKQIESPPPGPRQIHVRPSGPPTAPPAPKVPLPMLHGVESLAVRPDEDLEVVDFSDMGKFVGVAERPPSTFEQEDLR